MNKEGKEHLAKHPGSENLRTAPQWKPGQSGNPAGRKPGQKDGIRAHLNRLLRKQAPAKALAALRKRKASIDKGTYAEVITHMLGVAALTGKASDRISAVRLILDQTELPLPRREEVGGPGDFSSMTDKELEALIKKEGTNK